MTTQQKHTISKLYFSDAKSHMRKALALRAANRLSAAMSYEKWSITALHAALMLRGAQ